MKTYLASALAGGRVKNLQDSNESVQSMSDDRFGVGGSMKVMTGSRRDDEEYSMASTDASVLEFQEPTVPDRIKDDQYNTTPSVDQDTETVGNKYIEEDICVQGVMQTTQVEEACSSSGIEDSMNVVNVGFEDNTASVRNNMNDPGSIDGTEDCVFKRGVCSQHKTKGDKMRSKTKVWKKRKFDYGWVTVTKVSYRCKHRGDSCSQNSLGDAKPGLPETDLNGSNSNTSPAIANEKGELHFAF